MLKNSQNYKKIPKIPKIPKITKIDKTFSFLKLLIPKSSHFTIINTIYILEQGDTKIYYRGCMNAYPGYKAGECWEQDDPGIGSGKSKICFCGEDECNGFDMAEDELDK